MLFTRVFFLSFCVFTFFPLHISYENIEIHRYNTFRTKTKIGSNNHNPGDKHALTRSPLDISSFSRANEKKARIYIPRSLSPPLNHPLYVCIIYLRKLPRPYTNTRERITPEDVQGEGGQVLAPALIPYPFKRCVLFS